MKKGGVGFLVCLVSVSFLGADLAGQAPRAPQNGPDVRFDYVLARRDIQRMEAVINNVINSTFTNSPFALTQRTKGVYLKGYGVAFNFLVDIHTAVVMTPFGRSRRFPEVMPAEKKRRIEEIKEKLVRALIGHGDGLSQLPKDESVTIVAFIQDRNFPEEENQNRTVVMRALKRDLDELAHKENRWKELKQRMEIVEY